MTHPNFAIPSITIFSGRGIQMRLTLYLAVAVLFLGCDQSPREVPVNGSPATGPYQDEANQQISLAPSDLEKLATWDEASQAGAVLLNRLNDVLAKIEDEETAKAAIPRLKAIGPKIAAVSRAEASLGDPSPEDLAIVQENMASANSRFDELSQALAEDPQIDAVVGGLIFEVYSGQSMDE